jgi:hypothetical protein
MLSCAKAQDFLEFFTWHEEGMNFVHYLLLIFNFFKVWYG